METCLCPIQTAAESPANIVNHGLLTQPNLHKYVRGVCTLPYMDRVWSHISAFKIHVDVTTNQDCIEISNEVK